VRQRGRGLSAGHGGRGGGGGQGGGIARGGAHKTSVYAGFGSGKGGADPEDLDV
jgi:hypothetical protein